ncbi:MAG TPA: hypothetical protein VHA73_03720 [Acidimicrobiales bacterium]|jgi:hypothetical protein|nr:hypothetical protein [Acidimicrobiales bacterium]
MVTYIVRTWLPDRPGALGAVASRVGAVRGDVVGIDILERDGGQAVDELVVELPDEGLVELLVAEMSEVDGVKIESVALVEEGVHDPRLDALETAAQLVGASDPLELEDHLCTHAGRTLGAAWVALVDVDAIELRSATGAAPDAPWLAAFVRGSQAATQLAGPDGIEHSADDVAWAPLPAADLVLVAGRSAGPRFRARERRQLAALARIADTRLRELVRLRSRQSHPANG